MLHIKIVTNRVRSDKSTR